MGLASGFVRGWQNATPPNLNPKDVDKYNKYVKERKEWLQPAPNPAAARAIAMGLGAIATPLRIVTEQATALEVAANLAFNNPNKYLSSTYGIKNLFNRSRELAYGNRDGREWWQHGEDNVTLGQSIYANYTLGLDKAFGSGTVNLDKLSTEARAHYFDSNSVAKYLSGYYDFTSSVILDPLNYVGVGLVGKGAKVAGLSKRGAAKFIPPVYAYTEPPGFLNRTLAQEIERGLRIYPTSFSGIPFHARKTLLAERELSLANKNLINENINGVYFSGSDEYNAFVATIEPDFKPFDFLPSHVQRHSNPILLKNGELHPYVDYLHAEGDTFALRVNKNGSRTLFKEVSVETKDGNVVSRWVKVKYIPDYMRSKIENYKYVSDKFTTPSTFAEDVLAQQTVDIGLQGGGRSSYLYNVASPRQSNLANISVKTSTGWNAKEFLPDGTRFLMVKDSNGRVIRLAVSPEGETWFLGQYTIKNLAKPKLESKALISREEELVNLINEQPIGSAERLSLENELAALIEKSAIALPKGMTREQEIAALSKEQSADMGNEKFIADMEAKGYVDSSTGEIIDFDSPELSDVFRREFSNDYDNLWGEYGDAETFNKTQETLGSSYTIEGEITKPKVVERTGTVWVKTPIDPKKVSYVEHNFINGFSGEAQTSWIPAEYRLTNAGDVSQGSMPIFIKDGEYFTVYPDGNTLVPYKDFSLYKEMYQDYINDLEKFSADYIKQQQESFVKWMWLQKFDEIRMGRLEAAGKLEETFPSVKEVIAEATRLEELQVIDPIKYRQITEDLANANITVYFDGVKTSDGGLDIILKRHHRMLDEDFAATGEEFEDILGTWHLTPDQANAIDSYAARSGAIHPLSHMFEYGENKSLPKIENERGELVYPTEDFNKTHVSTNPRDLPLFGEQRWFKDVRAPLAATYDRLEWEIARIHKNIARIELTISNAKANKFGEKTVASQEKVLTDLTAQRDALIAEHKSTLQALVDAGWANSSDPNILEWLGFSQTKVVPYYEGYLQRMLDLLNKRFGTSVRVWDDVERDYSLYTPEQLQAMAKEEEILKWAAEKGAEIEAAAKLKAKGSGSPTVNKIDLFREENSFLSNMFDSPITVRGETYPTAEHAFQAAKFTDKTKRDTIAAAKSPAEAKKLGRQSGMRSDWNEKRIPVMEEILRAKFEQNPDLMEKLVATGDAELIEGNTWGDKFWGQVNGEGENNLGKILMKLREEFRNA